MIAWLALLLATPAAAQPVDIGSKRFTESYVLAELARTTVERAGCEARHVEGLGGTAIVFEAIRSGQIDLYPDYLGTLGETLLHDPRASREAIDRALSEHALSLIGPLGFENGYALAVRDGAHPELRRLSQLRDRELTLGLTPEILGRNDGWPGLAATYGLDAQRPRGTDHAVAYEAIRSGALDVIDVYTTDAKIARYGLRVLDDDRHFFPSYQAFFVVRRDAPCAAGLAALRALEGAIDAPRMIAANASVELDGRSFAEAGAALAAALHGQEADAPAARPTFAQQLLEVVASEGPRHVMLVLLSVLLAALVGVPLGVFAHARPRLGAAIVTGTGVLQTIPSLALLAFFVPLLGIGVAPTLAALFLYGLLPIVRGTVLGLASIPSLLRDTAIALGLPPRARLFSIELPLASRAIVAGIKSSAVINVGTATIAAFIGAGGFGQPISTGLNLNDPERILSGAIPAAALAFLVEGGFALLERRVVPEGLRTA